MADEPVAVATGGDAPSVDEEAAGQASQAAGAEGARDDVVGALAAQTAAMNALVEELRAARETVPAPEPPPAPEPEPERRPASKPHWINRKIGGK